MMRKFAGTAVMALLLWTFGASHVDASPIVFSVSHLSGSTWEYTYDASGLGLDPTPPPYEGFSVYFDFALYDNLSYVSANPNWYAAAVEPDASFSLDGRFDAQAQSSGAFPILPFVVDFTWLGDPRIMPGAQLYTLIQSDDPDGTVNFTETPGGITQLAGGAAPVPEPTTLILVGGGLAGIARRFRRRSS